MTKSICGICLIVLGTLLAAEKEARLLRFPAIHDEEIVFGYAGDLYTVGASGGVARKLTSHPGYEMFPRFSPDGKYLAFTGQYDGNTEVYLMPAQGGEPRRLTYTATIDRDDVWDRMGPNNIVMTWQDNEHVVFRSRMHSFNPFIGQLYVVDTAGNLPKELPLPRGGFCSYSPDGQKLVYNRIFREFRTWKRYRGGMADDVWIYDLKTETTRNITGHPAQDIIPMWYKDWIYFLSDREGIMNLYAYDLTTQGTVKVTDFKEFDVKFPALGPNAIVLENGGYIYRFDPATGKSERVPIFIQEDMLGGREAMVDVSSDIAHYQLSPDGKRALFTARGEIFTVPQQHGTTRNLSKTSGVHEREAKWSPDGKWIAYISDQSGEDQIYVMPAGCGPSQALTLEDLSYKYQLEWSPDSTKILWSDKRLRLRYVELGNKKITEVDQATSWEIRHYSWSPDSRWICYARPESVTNTVYLYSLEEGKNYAVTSGDSPVFSRDGKYLLFVSVGNYNPSFCRLEWNYIYDDMDRIYLVTLAGETESPFRPKSDEVSMDDGQSQEQKPGKKGQAQVTVEISGLKQRVQDLPIAPGGCWYLSAADNCVYYMKKASRDQKASVCLYDLNELKETTVTEANGYRISANGKKMLIAGDGAYYLIDLPKTPVVLKTRLDLSQVRMRLLRREEWQQIFAECWRQTREFFYAPNMHGIPWDDIKKKYQPLVEYVNHRADLTYIIGEMIGELSVGHTYVGGGDVPEVEQIPIALLGAELDKDSSGYFRIHRILPGQNWREDLRSPLTEIGVNVHEGDYIISVNGESTAGMANIYRALVGRAKEQVTLEVNSIPSAEGSRKVTIKPVASEAPLYYYNWVETNIRKVDKATNGQVGYLHLPDMGVSGLNEFARYFYPQLRKKALIVDVRNNGGGYLSGVIIERLRREIALVEIARNTTPNPEPWAMVYGPKVCLINEFSASDGDIFPYRFKRYKLGKVIGKRSWGGVVGIRDSLPLMDGGYLYKPEFACYDPDGKGWVIEGHGVDPDIVVDNDPAKEYRGIDEQLDKAIEVILDELKRSEKSLPPIPEYPDKH